MGVHDVHDLRSATGRWLHWTQAWWIGIDGMFIAFNEFNGILMVSSSDFMGYYWDKWMFNGIYYDFYLLVNVYIAI